MNRRLSFRLSFRLSAALLAACVALPAAAADADTAGARAAAGDWLAKLDAADYPASWRSAAVVFQAAVSEQGWASAAQSARQPLGAVRSRSEKSAAPARSLPGVPDGNYVVFQYDSVFDKKPGAVELVTTAQDKDGRWKVAGYFIQ